MPPWGSISRRVLIQSLQALGWEGRAADQYPK